MKSFRKFASENSKLAVMLTIVAMFSASYIAQAQMEQTESSVTIKVESTKIIGNLYMVSGKISASKKLRLNNFEVKGTDGDGEEIKAEKFWMGSKHEYSFAASTQEFEPDIPLSFRIGFDTKSKNLNSLSNVFFKYMNHTEFEDMERWRTITLKDLPVPTSVDPNLATAERYEIENNIYLRWTKTDNVHVDWQGKEVKPSKTSKQAFRIHFVVENMSGKEAEMTFRNDNFIIDNDGNQHKGSLSLRNEKFQPDIPLSGTFVFEGNLKANDIRMLKFKSNHIDYSVRKLEFPPASSTPAKKK